LEIKKGGDYMGIPDPMDAVRMQLDPMIGISAHLECRPIFSTPSNPFAELHHPANPVFQHEIQPLVISSRDHRCGSIGCRGHQNPWETCF
jgi:hypothetical protein